eukprot:2130688-Rhodomonas_salina.1
MAHSGSDVGSISTRRRLDQYQTWAKSVPDIRDARAEGVWGTRPGSKRRRITETASWYQASRQKGYLDTRSVCNTTGTIQPEEAKCVPRHQRHRKKLTWYQECMQQDKDTPKRIGRKRTLVPRASRGMPKTVSQSASWTHACPMRS